MPVGVKGELSPQIRLAPCLKALGGIQLPTRQVADFSPNANANADPRPPLPRPPVRPDGWLRGLRGASPKIGKRSELHSVVEARRGSDFWTGRRRWPWDRWSREDFEQLFEVGFHLDAPRHAGVPIWRPALPAPATPQLTRIAGDVLPSVPVPGEARGVRVCQRGAQGQGRGLLPRHGFRHRNLAPSRVI